MTAIVETDGDAHVYRPSRAHTQAGRIMAVGFAVFVALFLLFGIWGTAHSTGQPPKPEEFALLLFPALILVLSIRPGARTPHRLIVSPRGIAFHRPGLSIETEWENTKEIRMTYQPVLVLKRPAATYRSPFSYQPRMTREIPLDIFDFDHYSALAQDIRTYAPHLFKDDPPRHVRADVDEDDPWL